MLVIFILLAIIVVAFLIMVCMTLFRIEKTTKLALTIAERKIVKTYGGRRPDAEN